MNKSETLKIESIIANASLNDLRLIRTMLSDRQDTLGWENKNTLKVGQLVKVNHPKLKGVTLEVTKINRTKASVRSHVGYGAYTVPLSLIESL